MDKLQEIRIAINKEIIHSSYSLSVYVNVSDINYLFDVINEKEEIIKDRSKDIAFYEKQLKQQEQEIDNYKFALSNIQNTQCFMSQGKMQYTTAGQIAKKALDKSLVNTR